MRTAAFAQLSDDELFHEVSRRRAGGEDFRPQVGELCERWRAPAYTVVRRVQGSFFKGAPEDCAELFQDAVGKFLARGLEQFHGVSEFQPGQAASPRTFFLRIVKHAAIDRYRASREDVRSAPDTREDAPFDGEAPQQVARAMESARHREEERDAREEYGSAYRRLCDEHPKEAAAWELYHHQDVEDHVECARRLEISVTNSYKRVSRAQAYMRLYLLEQRREEESE